MTTLKYGLALPYVGAREVAELCQLAEQAGWDGCFLGDAIWCEDPMIALAAAAMVTRRIRLGTLIVPVPLRKPWKVASESLALDRLSAGRLILGLGAGAVWMGWQCFPDEVTDTKARAEMLDESIEILTLLYQRRQFDYEGKHFHLKLTQMDLQHFPPQPVQQPRIPIWVPGLWPRQKSMQRVLKCDGILVEKLTAEGKGETPTPADVCNITAFIQANRTLTTPLDIVVQGQSTGLEAAQAADQMQAWAASGATWWVEAMFGASPRSAREFIRQGPPRA